MSRFWLSAGIGAALSCASMLAYAAPAYVEAALSDPARPQGDRDSDAMRKPADMIDFAGIKPGMTVVDIAPGGGYFTRIFAKVVGANGKVYAVNNPPRPRPAPPAGAPPMGPPGGGRGPQPPLNEGYPNVELITTSPIVQGFMLPQKADVMWTSRNYHDFKNASPDLSAFNKAVFDGLKPGGIFIVLDHAADENDTPDVTSRLHRIQESRVKTEVVAAGFRLVGESNVLRNPQDDHKGSNAEADLRGHTDQFILKFQKP